MESKDALDEFDILKEVGSIAAGHGSIALSTIFGEKIDLQLPSVKVVVCQEISKNIALEKIGIVLFCRPFTGLRGEVAFVLDGKNAYKLVDIDYEIKARSKPAMITEAGLSLIKEIGNIVIGAYLNALSLIFKRIIIPSVPTLLNGSIKDILNILLSSYNPEDRTFLIEASLREPHHKFEGYFYLILSPDSAEEIRRICKHILETIKVSPPDSTTPSPPFYTKFLKFPLDF